MIRQRKCPCRQDRKKSTSSRIRYETSVAYTVSSSQPYCNGVETVTGQQRHHIRFLKVTIALVSVGDGSNLLRPYTVETMARMEPELWICARLEMASSSIRSFLIVEHCKKKLPHPPARDPSRAKSLRRMSQILMSSRGETLLMWKSAGDDEPGPQW